MHWLFHLPRWWCSSHWSGPGIIWGAHAWELGRNGRKFTQIIQHPSRSCQVYPSMFYDVFVFKHIIKSCGLGHKNEVFRRKKNNLGISQKMASNHWPKRTTGRVRRRSNSSPEKFLWKMSLWLEASTIVPDCPMIFPLHPHYTAIFGWWVVTIFGWLSPLIWWWFSPLLMIE